MVTSTSQKGFNGFDWALVSTLNCCRSFFCSPSSAYTSAVAGDSVFTPLSKACSVMAMGHFLTQSEGSTGNTQFSQKRQLFSRTRPDQRDDAHYTQNLHACSGREAGILVSILYGISPSFTTCQARKTSGNG